MIYLIGVQILFALIILVLLLYVAYVLWTFRRIVPYVPTPYSVINKMIKAAGLKKGEKVIDLGCGTGRIVYQVASQHLGLVIGLEKFPLLLAVAKARYLVSLKRAKVKFVKGDMFSFNLEPFEVVFCFLTSQGMKLLEPSFQKLKPGSRLVSYMFALKDHSNFNQRIIEFGKKDRIFVYTKVN